VKEPSKGEDIMGKVDNTEMAKAKVRVQNIDRSQMVLEAVDVDRLVEADHPVRAIWELTGQLDLERFYAKIKAVEGGAGRDAVDPRVLICLLAYAYSIGEGSARKMSELCEYHPAFRWLTGLRVINHHTISDFRIDHKGALDELFTQLLGVLMAKSLIGLEQVMQDGTKIKAFASADTFRREERLEKCLDAARQQMKVVEETAVEGAISKRSVKAKQRAYREKLQLLEEAKKQLKELQGEKPKEKEKAKMRVSTTDPDARFMKQADGGFAPAYNVQISTDSLKKIIVGMDVTQSRSDFPELINGIEKVKELTGVLPPQVVVDGGYTSRENIIAASDLGVDLIGPMADNRPQSEGLLKGRGVKEAFFPQAFIYHDQADTYTCPMGKTLTHCRTEKRPTQIFHIYQASVEDCGACTSKGDCCPKSEGKGRSLMRVEEAPQVSAFVDKMKTEEAKAIYKQRGPVAEFPNAWIKEKFGLRQFRLRGLTKVQTEALWVGLTYNIKQWVRLCWKPAQMAAAIG
jgi:transposase/ribosomal protein L5